MFGGWEEEEIHSIRPEWLEGYDRAGIDFRSLKGESVTWWDTELLQMLVEHGPKHFRKLNIWDMDWNALAASLGIDGVDLADPRSSAEKAIHYLLVKTQNQRTNLGVRAFERLLRLLGW